MLFRTARIHLIDGKFNQIANLVGEGGGIVASSRERRPGVPEGSFGSFRNGEVIAVQTTLAYTRFQKGTDGTQNEPRPRVLLHECFALLLLRQWPGIKVGRMRADFPRGLESGRAGCESFIFCLGFFDPLLGSTAEPRLDFGWILVYILLGNPSDRSSIAIADERTAFLRQRDALVRSVQANERRNRHCRRRPRLTAVLIMPLPRKWGSNEIERWFVCPSLN